MEKEFIPFELALELKELGFDKNCLGYYNHKQNFVIISRNPDFEYIVFKYKCKNINKSFNLFPDNEVKRKQYITEKDMSEKYCLAPLWQQAFDWFREEHNIHSYINLTNIQGELTWHVNICSVDKHEVGVSRIVLCNLFDFKTYEEARQACLEKLIELCKKK